MYKTLRKANIAPEKVNFRKKDWSEPKSFQKNQRTINEHIKF